MRGQQRSQTLGPCLLGIALRLRLESRLPLAVRGLMCRTRDCNMRAHIG